MTSFCVPDVPLEIYNDYVLYQNKRFKITSLEVNEPFKFTIKTPVATFQIAKLSNSKCGIQVSGNYLEEEYGKVGYNLIFSGCFDMLIDVLF